MTTPTFFRTPAHFRKWLDKHHGKATELLVGYYKVDSGKPSMTWQQSVDEALCFGWIDGIRRRIDDESYSIRFTPRKAGSNWSAVNIKRAKELAAAGLMMQAGLDAFAQRDETRSEVYSYERKHAELSPDALKILKADKKAWNHFTTLAPGYRRLAAHWVASAKREETRARRLAELIERLRRGERVGVLAPPSPKKPGKRAT
jgi:uncharacterized protein YdeI (YjbR/CyaY-like superfamily)